MRWIFALAGLAALGWGAWLAVDVAAGHDSIQAAAWFIGGPLVHDGLVAPAVGLGGLVLTRVLAQQWRAPVAVGTTLSGVLALLSVPLLWRPFGVATNPGLHDGNYALGLAIALAAVWAGVVTTGVLRTRKSAARGRARG